MKILDCTLRDGGYYNQWDFEPSLVNDYLKAVASAKVHYIELGLRSFPRTGFAGASAYTTEQYLDSILLPEGPLYGVMVDAKTILSSDLSITEAVKTLFVQEINSKLSFVRVAAHFHEIDECYGIVKALHELGYIVGLNLMQSGGKSAELLTAKAKLIDSWGYIDVLYFADSLGNMDKEEVLRIVKALKVGWAGAMGIHTHNNMGNALTNTLTALDNGVDWLDCTVTGMGRGAGNAETELLLSALNKRNDQFNCTSLYQLVIDKFEPMKKKFGWGQSLLYFLGAQAEVHPTYIQNLLSDSHVGSNEIVGAIEHLCELNGTSSYSSEVLSSALSVNNVTNADVMGDDSLVGIFNEREVLILAGSPSLERYYDGVISYINQNTPIVIALNTLDDFPSDLVDFYCVSHNLKYISENEKYKSLTKPLIYPGHRFGGDVDFIINHAVNNINYGVDVQPGVFEALRNYAVVPYDLTIAYALAISVIGKAERVNLVGFEGYPSNDDRQREMVDLFTAFKSFDMPILALTPSTYPIAQGTIYAPKI